MREPGQERVGDSGLNALLGPGSVVEGKLSFQGQVRIDGTFNGSIKTTDTLIIGESARITAEITCGSVVVNGEVNGNITAKESVELHRPARVKGDIATPSLVIDKGVIFEGSSRMENGRVVELDRSVASRPARRHPLLPPAQKES
jgi:cytoskeletal protein CcmA (bactofilin family)